MLKTLNKAGKVGKHLNIIRAKCNKLEANIKLNSEKLKIAQLSPYPLLCICLPDRRLPWWLRWQKPLPTMQEIWVRFLGWEDPLEKGKATHSSILAWRIHGL